MSNAPATAPQFTVKYTTGFEQNVRRIGLYPTKAAAITAARAMQAKNRDGYYVAVPAPKDAAGKMAALMEMRTTDQLFACLLHLERMPKTPETRLVGAAISDAITLREGIDAELDAIFEDLEFAGTYREAMLLAMAAKTAR